MTTLGRRVAAPLGPRGGEPQDEVFLIHATTGFMDAGSAGGHLAAYLEEHTDGHTVVEFDVDLLFDYRSRRPMMTFEVDHFTSVEPVALVLQERFDDVGQRFFLLKGPEPDQGWKTLLDEACELVDEFGITTTIGLHGVPWPAPHTRPVHIIGHGNDPRFTAHHPSWFGTVQVPGSFGNLLEWELGQRDRTAGGFAAQVPHYLVQAAWPHASLALLYEVMATTPLVFSVDDLRTAADEIDAQVSLEVADSEETQSAVSMLETRYDAMHEARTEAGLEEGNALGDVSADEIGMQVEEFLRRMNGGGDERR